MWASHVFNVFLAEIRGTLSRAQTHICLENSMHCFHCARFNFRILQTAPKIHFDQTLFFEHCLCVYEACEMFWKMCSLWWSNGILSCCGRWGGMSKEMVISSKATKQSIYIREWNPCESRVNQCNRRMNDKVFLYHECVCICVTIFSSTSFSNGVIKMGKSIHSSFWFSVWNWRQKVK